MHSDAGFTVSQRPGIRILGFGSCRTTSDGLWRPVTNVSLPIGFRPAKIWTTVAARPLENTPLVKPACSHRVFRLICLDTSIPVSWRWFKRGIQAVKGRKEVFVLPRHLVSGCCWVCAQGLSAGCSTQPPARGPPEAVRASPGFKRRAKLKRLTKARKSIGDSRILARSWPFNESFVTTDTTLHPMRAALWTRPGAGRGRWRRPDSIAGCGFCAPGASSGLGARAICLVAAPFVQLPCFSSGTPLSRRRNHHLVTTRLPMPCRGASKNTPHVSVFESNDPQPYWRRCVRGDTHDNMFAAGKNSHSARDWIVTRLSCPPTVKAARVRSRAEMERPRAHFQTPFSPGGTILSVEGCIGTTLQCQLSAGPGPHAKATS